MNLKVILFTIFYYELKGMNKNKRQAILFFESNAALMSNEIRQLIFDSLYSYRNFFRRFKKETYQAPEQIFENEKQPKATINDCFLDVKLIA